MNNQEAERQAKTTDKELYVSKLELNGGLNKTDIIEQNMNAFDAGVDAILSRLSELNKPDLDLVQKIAEYEYTMELQNLNDRLNANESFMEGIIVGVKAGFAKLIPSTDKGLVQKIKAVLNNNSSANDCIYEHRYPFVASEIAKLIPSTDRMVSKEEITIKQMVKFCQWLDNKQVVNYDTQNIKRLFKQFKAQLK